MKDKVRTVMKEFKSGDLKSSSGKKVTNPKQAIAIALSEAGKSKSMKEGGHMKESKEMMKKEVSFMKKKGAPKSMIKHEMKEAGMKHGGKVKKMAGGGLSAGHKSADGVAKKGKTDTKQVAMKKGGAVKKMRYGGKC
jgi:hypothetical protein